MKKYSTYIIIFLLLVISYQFVTGKTQQTQLDQLQSDKHRDITYLIYNDYWRTRELDMAVAEALLATTQEDRKKALLLAQNSTKQASPTTSSSIYFQIFQESYPMEKFWRDSSSYLTFLVEKNTGEFSPHQIEQLTEIRERANLISELMRELRVSTEFVQYQLEPREISAYLGEKSLPLSGLQEIGKEDKQFQNYLWARKGYPEPSNLLFQDEPWLGQDQLSAKAKAFMGDLWGHEEQSNVTGAGGSYTHLIGETRQFSPTSANKSTSSFAVNVSVHGGHIISVTTYDYAPDTFDHAYGEMTSEEVQAFAQKMINQWGVVPLELAEEDRGEELTRLVYAPIEGEALNHQKPVIIRINHVIGRLVSFDASLYYLGDQKTVANEIRLDPPTAATYLPKLVTKSAEAKLEITAGKSRGSQYVYTIPVVGLPRVVAIQVNAEHGKLEGIVFE
ncbi:hypothetical protein DS745_08510 [Anaerobacillus alkaliphilus]|uniref:Germination protein YpeB n=1 Tax=Anaerobacillus alkaliphilus TaxID=1548597 RepID=A0A4Q0VTP5_9BACI|nr:hypothetical protein [Anaerobacillus alkaliphilus]RXJ01982.1 hypothetical protein DS745_08510 [Anaerobacillus alkaliphilus]